MLNKINISKDSVIIAYVTIDASNHYSFNWADAKHAKTNYISPHIYPGCPSINIANYLKNLLPEGENLEVLSIGSQISKKDTLGLLAVVGGDVSGQLEFTTDEPHSFKTDVTEEEIEFAYKNKDYGSSINYHAEHFFMGLTGCQLKLPITIKNGLALNTDASTHIFKFKSEKQYHETLNEYICMQLAKSIGIPTANTSLIRTPHDNVPILCVERFDRTLDETGAIKKRQVLDACQMINVDPQLKYERPYGSGRDVEHINNGISINELAILSSNCKKRKDSLNQLADWVVFQIYIENADAHGKNLSFFFEYDKYELAPAYDMLNVLFSGGAGVDTEFAMMQGDVFNINNLTPHSIQYLANDLLIPPNVLVGKFRKIGLKILNELEHYKFDLIATNDLEKTFCSNLINRITSNTLHVMSIAKECK